jgi:D-lactate dehydrogenase
MSDELPEDFLNSLKSSLPTERLLLDVAQCWTYGFDNSRKQATPQAVALPVSHDEVVAITKLCNQYKVPLVLRGRGTGTTGGSAPDPGSASVCTVGGNLAFNAAGPRAVKYSTTRENTLGLVAVTANGETLHTGVKTTKGVTGYDMTRLLIGSEGTLAIITEATLKLLPLPESKRTITASYSTIQGATNAIVAIMNQSLIPSALEFLDTAAIDLIRFQPGIDLAENSRALLLIEVDGLENGMADAVKQISSAADNPSLLEIKQSNNEQEAAQLWAVRKHCRQH